MPSKNTRKRFIPNSYYHIYNRGINKQEIFIDREDVATLFTIISRYLDPRDTQVDFDKIPYKKYNNQVEIQCYCIMKNHYHLLVWIGEDTQALSAAMQSIWTSYTKYFNKKYQRIGPLFQDRYKASAITNDGHLAYITRYIHLNPSDYQNHPYSSIKTFQGIPHVQPGWLNPTRTLRALEGCDYAQFLKGDISLLEGQAS